MNDLDLVTLTRPDRTLALQATKRLVTNFILFFILRCSNHPFHWGSFAVSVTDMYGLQHHKTSEKSNPKAAISSCSKM